MEDTFEITDFRMAGFLVARGAKFVRTHANAKNELVYVFDNRPDGSHPAAEGVVYQYPGSPEERYDAACRAMHNFVKNVRSGKK